MMPARRPPTLPPTMRRLEAALLLGLCAVATYCSLSLLVDDGVSSLPDVRRSLQAAGRGRRNRHQRRKTLEGLPPAAAHPWAQHNLLPLAEPPRPAEETALFWHIPKSGGTTAKSIYECFDKTIASRAGALPKFGHDHDDEILAYRPWDKRNKGTGPRYVNVDTTQKSGILRAAQLGLVPSGLADVIFTSDPAFAIEHLYDESHKGRALGLFRHPVDRLVSKFYYLRIATWERTYRPQWKKVHLLDFAKGKNNDNNHMVKKLAGKTMSQQANEGDLRAAMETVRNYFVVGLMSEMEESIRRFNVVMGIDDALDENRRCMDEYFGEHVEKKNSNSHPKVDEGHPAWKVLAEKNELDIRLYEFLVRLFEEQRDVVAAYAVPRPAQEEPPQEQPLPVLPEEMSQEEISQVEPPQEEPPLEEMPREEPPQEEPLPEEPLPEEPLPEAALQGGEAVSDEGPDDSGPSMS